MAIGVIDLFKIIEIYYKQPFLSSVSFFPYLLKGVVVDQPCEPSPLSQKRHSARLLLSLLHLLSQGFGIVLSLSLLQVRHGLMDMHDFPSVSSPLIEN